MHHKRTESQANKLNDVIVIGAGLSGLSAAKVCHDKGLNVLVLEARDRVGGLTLSDDNGSDLGGAFFIQEHRNLFNLIAELGLKYQADVSAAIAGGVPVFYDNITKTKCCNDDPNQVPFAGKFNLLAKLDFFAAKRRINDLCVKIDLIEPWNTRNAKELDSISFKQFIETTCYTTQVKKFFLDFLIPINLTNEAEDCSLLHALCFIRSWGGVERCIGMDKSGATSRVVGGAQLLSTRLCQQIGEERVLLNKPVHTVDQQTNSELVTVITKDGTKYEASRVIVALPPNLQTAITFKPNIPLKSQLNHRYPAGLCTKVILHYDRAYWNDNGFNGHLNVVGHKQIGRDERRSRGKSGRDNNNNTPKRFESYRRSVCKTSSSSEKDDNLYASTNSLLLPGGGPVVGVGSGCQVGAVGNNAIHNGDRNNLMLKETKESFYPQSSLSILDQDYCPVSFVTPDYSRGQCSLIAHICGPAWIKYHQIEKEEDRIALVAKSYARILHPSLIEPLSYKELNWVNEDYSRGAYTSIMTPGTMTKFGRALKAPFGRIAFASTELSTYWPCTMEGAIRSGRKAALKILKDLQRVDVYEEEFLDDEEVLVQTHDTFIERHANKLLSLTKIALTAPTMVLIAALVGISLQKTSFKWTVSF